MAPPAQPESQPKFGSLDIEGIIFESSVVAPGSTKQLVLGGAGDRSLEIDGKSIKFTSMGIYVEEGIVAYLSPKLRGKSVEELCDKELLFEEVVAAPFEKLLRVYFLLPLTGPVYSEKLVEKLGLQGIYTDLKDESKQQFLEIFKAETLPPRSSVVFSFSAEGLKISFPKGDKLPEKPAGVIEDKRFADAILATAICKDGVSPTAKLSLAERLSKYF